MAYDAEGNLVDAAPAAIRINLTWREMRHTIGHFVHYSESLCQCDDRRTLCTLGALHDRIAEVMDSLTEDHLRDPDGVFPFDDARGEWFMLTSDESLAYRNAMLTVTANDRYEWDSGLSREFYRKVDNARAICNVTREA